MGASAASSIAHFELPQDALALLIGMGLFTVLLAGFGLYGALRRNKLFLFIFSLLVFLLVILELIGAIILWSYIGSVNAVSAFAGNGEVVLQCTFDLIFSQRECGIDGFDTGRVSAVGCTRPMCVRAVLPQQP